MGFITALAAMTATVGPVSAGNLIPVTATTSTSASSTYQVVPSKGVVNVTVILKVTNRTPDYVESYSCDRSYYDIWLGWIVIPRTCTRRTRYYVTTTDLTVESSATALKVSSSAGKVKLRENYVIPTIGSPSVTKSYEVTFPKLFRGQTRTIRVSYVLRNGAPRSGSSVRMNGAYLNFWGISQPTDIASVKVIVPSGFDTSTRGGALNESRKGANRIFTNGKVKDPSSYWFAITGTNLDGYARAVIATASGRTVTLEGWPGDDEWMAAVKEEVNESLPELEALTGQVLPATGTLTLREVADDHLENYIPVYYPTVQIALISEYYLPPGGVTHAMAHAWFNEDRFAATWMAEGYAGWATAAVGADTNPCGPPSVLASDSKALGAWKYADANATSAQLNEIRAQYTSACSIISEVAASIGEAGMRSVLAVLASDGGAYPGTHASTAGSPASWRTWLDAVEEQAAASAEREPMAPAAGGGESDLADLLVTYGIATEDDLVARADARSALAVLRSNKLWTIPDAVYRPMASWDFASASKAMTEMSATVDDVIGVADALAGVDPSGSPLRSRVAAAIGLADLVEIHNLADAQLLAATQVAGAVGRVQAANGPIEAVGLIGVDLVSMTAAAIDDVATLDVDGARAQVAAIDKTLTEATQAGALRLGGLVAAVSISLGLAFVLRRRHAASAGDASLDADGSEDVTRAEPALGETAHG